MTKTKSPLFIERMLDVYNALRSAQFELTPDEMGLLVHMVQEWTDPLDPTPFGLPPGSPVFGPAAQQPS